MMKRFLIVLGLLLAFATPTFAQVDELLSIRVEAAYDGWFRANQWMPLRVELENRGEPITGQVVVRPETTGNALPNTYSTPVELPTNSSQSLFLYITARSIAGTIRVELLNEANEVITTRDVNLRDIFARDQLYVVVTQAATNLVNLGEISTGGYEAFQANWDIPNIPDHPGALNAVNALFFNSADTGELTGDQQNAIRQWVLNGGHLFVTGGANWQATAAGFEGVLPMQPQTSTTVSDLDALTALAGDLNTNLSGETIIAEGELLPGARVLAATEDGTPLVVRGQVGNGTVDYLTFDPTSLPVREWERLPELWFSLLSSVDARPAWTTGFADWERAVRSVEILPGVDLLPAVLGLVGFLVAYVLLIGPVNYFILSRLNRREYAWVTIPVFILIFSVLAWSVGFEVRGNQATLSRLSIVQTWPDSEIAAVDQLIGLLAPRRDDYTLTMTDDRLLRPITADLADPNPLGGDSQSNINIRQETRFAAVDFPVDASFIRSFNTSGTITRPEIGGRLTLVADENIPDFATLRGSIRNDSDITLNAPVILTRGNILTLDEPFAPGDIVTLSGGDLALSGEGVPAPSPLEYAIGDSNPFFVTGNFSFRRSRAVYSSTARNTAQDILGADQYLRSDFTISFDDDEATQETRRRQALLDSFIIDQYGSEGRGNNVYLVGWAADAPTEEAVQGAGFDVVDTTLYIIELAVEREDADDVLISMDQFTWVSRAREGINDVGPVALDVLNETEVVFRFTPVPDAVLDEVEELHLIAARQRQSWPQGMLSIWDWEDERWVQQDFGADAQRLVIDAPGRFLGPQNAVELRVVSSLEVIGGSYPLDVLGIEQLGSF